MQERDEVGVLSLAWLRPPGWADLGYHDAFDAGFVSRYRHNPDGTVELVSVERLERGRPMRSRES